MELEDDRMHSVDCLLEGFEISGDGNDVLVKSLDLELVVLEVT